MAKTAGAQAVNTVERFIETLTANAAHVSCIRQLDEAIPLIERFMQEKALPPRLHLSPALQREWPVSNGITLSHGTTDGTHKLCASRAWAGIADTGTLVLLSGPDNPTRLNFLPDYHLVFLRKDQIVADKKAIWQKLEQQGALPRAVNFISGPSRTADIEQTIALGAHGPRFLWVFVEG
jgi:L-lactate dehydrogenase complex protein LldG